MPKRYYIGLATSVHDPAIAIVDDKGTVLFAEAAERRYQVKRAIACPPDNIGWIEDLINKYCEPGAEYIITKSWSGKTVRFLSVAHFLGIFRLSFNGSIKKALLKMSGMSNEEFSEAAFFLKNNLAGNISSGTGVEKVAGPKSDSGNVKHVAYDHHLSHAGLSCYGSPFREAVCFVIDGAGESGAFSVYQYKNGKITLLEKQKGRASLGTFYAWLTIFCGFDPMKGEEWKVMGLAAYGSYNERLHKAFRSMFYVDNCRLKYRKSIFDTRNIVKEIQRLKAEDCDNFSLRADIAYNGQQAYAQWMNELLTNIYKKYPLDNIILTGGCALNSSYNGVVLDNTPFKHLYVPSAPADDGNALGGALLAYYADNPHEESIHKNISAYLGTEITESNLRHFLQFSGHKVSKLASDKYEIVARLLAEGKIIGWVQGRAEFGPRALGNRSILADPRIKEIKDIVNERVKFREEFRPFAPAILHEYGNEYFENYQESQYMERALCFKNEVIGKVPGVVHEDNTGRLQSVKEEWNKELYYLIKAFYDITGVPVLLNTSFNIMGKPMIHTIEDAISTFLTTGVDVLVVNDHLIEK